MIQLLQVPIIRREEPAPGHAELWVQSEELAEAKPGQFADVVTQGMLRRPISFSRIDRSNHQVALLLQVVGEGTRWLAAQRPGTTLDVMGPLGKGFSAPDPHRAWCVVGGGVGIPPLLAAVEAWGSQLSSPPTAILGARDQSLILLAEEFSASGCVVAVATDNGTRGPRGTIEEPLREWLGLHPEGQVYACGPTPMLKTVARLTNGRQGVSLALEQRMGCGIGACLACVIPGYVDGAAGYLRVCTDGPVFRAEELIFE